MNVEAVAKQVGAWGVDEHPLAAVALTLARTLDEGAGMATAAVARELRACLLELAPKVDDDRDGTEALLARLSASMGDAKKPAAKKSRAKGGASSRGTRNAAAPVATPSRRRSPRTRPED